LKEKKLTAKGLRYFSANQVNDDDIELNWLKEELAYRVFWL
jgi:hypothetical protein